jgi:hypothetical protein
MYNSFPGLVISSKNKSTLLKDKVICIDNSDMYIIIPSENKSDTNNMGFHNLTTRSTIILYTRDGKASRP